MGQQLICRQCHDALLYYCEPERADWSNRKMRCPNCGHEETLAEFCKPYIIPLTDKKDNLVYKEDRNMKPAKYRPFVCSRCGLSNPINIDSVREELVQEIADVAVSWLRDNVPYSHIPSALLAEDSLRATIHAYQQPPEPQNMELEDIIKKAFDDYLGVPVNSMDADEKGIYAPDYDLFCAGFLAAIANKQ
jgi:DNA-directed RNA polymerase subunit M/transcription elongation factor TFIIS